jgi:choline dehydrogenase-like flavoprotein
MIRNGKDIANGTVISTQVCVIGSGPAGVTAAWYLQKAGLKVTLIEGSRPVRSLPQSWPDKLLLYNGVADGLFATNEREFLVRPYAGHTNPSERERVFGGTSAHWGGQSRPLDPITFESRPGFPGWPISRQDLDPYYKQAATFSKLYSDDFSAKFWAGVLNADVPHLDGFDAEMYQFIGYNYLNFATRTFDGGITIGQSAVDVILNASLLDIDHAQGVVTSLRVASMNDAQPTPQKATEFTVRADAFVLACGAVANARQLLLSNAGNEHDQVGRYFMCHPLSMSGVVSAYGYLTNAEVSLMNGDTFAGARAGNHWTDPNGVTVTGRFSPNAEQQRALGIGSCWFWANGGQYYFEMAPNADSRVTLDQTPDPVFGQPQTHITWQLSQRDADTYNQTTKLFQAAVSALGGTTSFDDWETVKSQLVVNGHHIGTTRMSAKPEDGVVDANLKVHSLDNLYVAGSSVFASTGISNPTFTIITLSIRLAEHLTGVMGKRPAA